jgi:hypothetical protein
MSPRPSRTRMPRGARALGGTARLAEPGIKSSGTRASSQSSWSSWRCHSCGLVLTSWAACERHCRDEHRPGCRFDCINPTNTKENKR